MKPYIIRYSRAALTDINEAIAYYEEQSPGLGIRFADAVMDIVAAIALNPLHAAVRYDQIHCRKARSFPYLIHYSIELETNEVIIEAVYNTWRQPLWQPPADE